MVEFATNRAQSARLVGGPKGGMHVSKVGAERRLEAFIGDARSDRAPLGIGNVERLAHVTPQRRRRMRSRLIAKAGIIQESHLNRDRSGRPALRVDEGAITLDRR